jgi:hypothetical protein
MIVRKCFAFALAREREEGAYAPLRAEAQPAALGGRRGEGCGPPPAMIVRKCFAFALAREREEGAYAPLRAEAQPAALGGKRGKVVGLLPQ